MASGMNVSRRTNKPQQAEAGRDGIHCHASSSSALHHCHLLLISLLLPQAVIGNPRPSLSRINNGSIVLIANTTNWDTKLLWYTNKRDWRNNVHLSVAN